MSNITQLVNSDKNMTTLKKGVVASGLDKILSGAGPFTIFAPSDIAFNKLDKGTLEDLLKSENKAKLEDVLNYHIVNGSVTYRDLKDGMKLKTVNGRELQVKVKDGQVSIQGANVENRLQSASNGVVHILDTVMVSN
jgi:uncharacterized surface protein with fasciclin (FAS1) repeats